MDTQFERAAKEIAEKMPTQLRGLIIALLTTALTNYLRQNPIGRALVEARYRLPDDDQNDRIPALSFIVSAKGALMKVGAAPYMPDLAVEVQSVGQSDKFMAEKAADYLAHGSRMVWLIYPGKRLVEVLTPTERYLLTEADTLSGGAVLPGFTLPIHYLFAEA